MKSMEKAIPREEPDYVPDARPSSQGAAVESVSVALVGLETSTEALVASALAGDPRFSVQSYGALPAARDAIEKAAPHATILVSESLELRKRRSFPPSVYVIALAGPDRSVRVDAEADEVIRRPISAEDLKLRLRLAARHLVSEQRLTIYGVLRDALRDAKSGEVTVSNGEEFARIHVDDGRLAWIHRSHHPVSVRALVEECGAAIDDDALRDLLEESRSSRRHFGDVLVDWGIVDKQRLRDSLKRKIRQDLEVILSWANAPATFVPGRSSLSSELAFEEIELPLSTPQPGRIETLPGFPAVRVTEPVDEGAINRWVDRIRAIEHVIGCAILDAKRGVVLAGRDMDERLTTIAWELAGGFAALGEDGDEILATTKRTTFLVRPAPLPTRGIAVVCFDSTRLSPAMARIVVSKAG
jgi:hypothetical protein